MKNISKTQTESDFENIKQEQSINRLVQRFQHKEYCEKYSWAKISALIISYIIQVVSISLAFYGIYWILKFLVPYPTLVALFAVTFLFFHAIGQRKTSDALWDAFHSKGSFSWMLAGFCILFMASSMIFSGFGQWKATIEANKNGAILIHNDSTLNFLEQHLALVNSDINALKKTTWKGKVTRESQKGISRATPNKNLLTSEVIERRKSIEKKNELAKQQHNSNIKFIAFITLFVYVFLEFLFESCMYFCSYYDWRKLVESMPQNELKEVLEGKQFSTISINNISDNKPNISGSKSPEYDLIIKLLEHVLPKEVRNNHPVIAGFRRENNLLKPQEKDKKPTISTFKNQIKKGADFQPESLETPHFQTEKEIVFKETKTTEIIDVSDAKKNIRNNWRRMHKKRPDSNDKKIINAYEQGIIDNTRKYNENLKILTEAGYTIHNISEGSLSIEKRIKAD